MAKKFIIKRPLKYELAKVTREDLKLTVSASGKIKSKEEATLKFQTSGNLVWVGVKKGDKVTKGQAIASLDKNELEKKLKQELLDYTNERWDYDQVKKDTYKDQVLTDTIKRIQEKGGFDMERTVLDVEIADIALKYATLITPIDGIITEIESPYSGVNILYTSRFVVSNPDKLIFAADIDEADIGKIKIGQKAEITLDAYPEEKIEGLVDQIDFTAVTTSGGSTAYRVEFLLPKNTEDQKFKIGMNGDAEVIITEKNNVKVIPVEAVKEKDDQKLVQILENQKPKELVITTGLESDSKVEILDGLKENQKVVVKDLSQDSKKK